MLSDDPLAPVVAIILPALVSSNDLSAVVPASSLAFDNSLTIYASRASSAERPRVSFSVPFLN